MAKARVSMARLLYLTAGYLTAGCAGATQHAAPRVAVAAQPTTVVRAPSPAPEPAPVEDIYLSWDQPSCPEDMALIDRVCVDRWEASLVQLLDDGSEVPWSPYDSPDIEHVRLRAVSRPDVVPQGYISGDQAALACSASGKRLCTELEWVAACRGPEQTTYPYGAERRKHICNDDGRPTHPVAEVTRRLGLPPERMWYEGMGQPLINQLKDTLQRTGARAECTNGYGVFDMVGNLHEWVDDPEGTFRGGFYMDTIVNGEGCDYATHAHPRSYHDYSTGFRCCADAVPPE